jgi:hypothetical protein
VSPQIITWLYTNFQMEIRLLLTFSFLRHKDSKEVLLGKKFQLS